MTAYRLWNREDAGDSPSRDPGRYTPVPEVLRHESIWRNFVEHLREEGRGWRGAPTWGARKEDGARFSPRWSNREETGRFAALRP